MYHIENYIVTCSAHNTYHLMPKFLLVVFLASLSFGNLLANTDMTQEFNSPA